MSPRSLPTPFLRREAVSSPARLLGLSASEIEFMRTSFLRSRSMMPFITSALDVRRAAFLIVFDCQRSVSSTISSPIISSIRSSRETTPRAANRMKKAQVSDCQCV